MKTRRMENTETKRNGMLLRIVCLAVLLVLMSTGWGFAEEPGKDAAVECDPISEADIYQTEDPVNNRRGNLNHHLLRRVDDESRSCCAENGQLFQDYGLKGANNEEVFAPKRVDRRVRT